MNTQELTAILANASKAGFGLHNILNLSPTTTTQQQ